MRTPCSGYRQDTAHVPETPTIAYPQAGAQLLGHHRPGRRQPPLLGGALSRRRQVFAKDEGQRHKDAADAQQRKQETRRRQAEARSTVISGCRAKVVRAYSVPISTAIGMSSFSGPA